jgi:hypothetical protein
MTETLTPHKKKLGEKHERAKAPDATSSPGGMRSRVVLWENVVEWPRS